MTRINAGYKVAELVREHLLAEHREIKRIPNMIKSGKAKVKDIPKEFTLGAGHVKFFYDKLLFLKNRYHQLYNESLKRGYNVTYYGDAFEDLPTDLMNDWVPTEAAIELITQRIESRLKKKYEVDIDYIPIAVEICDSFLPGDELHYENVCQNCGIAKWMHKGPVIYNKKDII